jgi:uncharacterized protein with HEPN domain
MLAYGREAVQMARGLSFDDLTESRKTRLALERLVEIVCEAASRIPDAERENYPDIPWNLIVGMRQKLVHDYHNVDLKLLWDTIEDDLPLLIRQLRLISRQPRRG